MPSYAVQLEHVGRIYAGARRTPPRTALDSISLTIERGAWVAILGPNGSGKSTMLRIVGAMDRPTQGSVRWFGDADATSRQRQSRIGVVLQTTSLDPLLTARENLSLQGAVFGMDRAMCASRIDDVAVELAIADRLNDRVGALSGGLARRVDLARALLTNPELLLLDEATAGLDPPARNEFLDAIARRRIDSDMTVLMTTHLIEEAERADRVIMMDQGAIVADGAPQDLRSELASKNEFAIHSSIESASLLRDRGFRVIDSSDGIIAMFFGDDERDIASALRELAAAGFTARIGAPTLEDVFVARTGHVLRTDRSGA